MNCIVRFCKNEKKSFRIKYSDIEDNGVVLRTIYRPEKCGNFLEKRIAHLCRGCEILGDNSLWLALQNIEGIINKLGKSDLVIFTSDNDKLDFERLLLHKNNVSILTDEDNLEKLSEKIISQSGAACVYSYKNFSSFENKNVLILPGFSGNAPKNAEKVVNLSGEILGCSKEILPHNIHYQPPQTLKRVCIEWGKDAKTLSSLIKFYNLPAENLHIFSL